MAQLLLGLGANKEAATVVSGRVPYPEQCMWLGVDDTKWAPGCVCVCFLGDEGQAVM